MWDNNLCHPYNRTYSAQKPQFVCVLQFCSAIHPNLADPSIDLKLG